LPFEEFSEMKGDATYSTFSQEAPNAIDGGAAVV